MPRRLPTLNALKAFEAAARYQSFTRAAEELNVTQGAVSHQVKALEDTLGLKLFHRERQRLILTEAGRDYLTVIRDALDQIAVGTERLLQRQESGVLTVSTSPDFAANWLVSRRSDLAEKYPDAFRLSREAEQKKDEIKAFAISKWDIDPLAMTLSNIMRIVEALIEYKLAQR